MLELPFLRNNRDEIEQRLSKRNIDAKTLVARALEIDEQRRSTQAELDAKQAELNTLSKAIGDLMKAGQRNEAETAKGTTVEIKSAVQGLAERLAVLEREQQDHLCTIPNAPSQRCLTAAHPRRTPWCCRKGLSRTLAHPPNPTGNWARSMDSCIWN
jgi:seryl-tRNA synthetase